MKTPPRYRSPDQYDAVFGECLSWVNALMKEASVARLIAVVSTRLNFPADWVEASFKRQLMIRSEFFPQRLLPRSLFLDLFRLLAYLRQARFIKALNAGEGARVIFDEWYAGAGETFYGRHLREEVSKATSTASINLSANGPFDFADLLKHLPAILQCLVQAARASGRTRLNLLALVVSCVTEFLSGLTIRKQLHPKVIVTGNDNGFPALKAAAAGANLIRIQNGVRSRSSDGMSIAADVYVGMGGSRFLSHAEELGWKIGKWLPFGSLRLATYLEDASRTQNASGNSNDYSYKYLYIGTWTKVPQAVLQNYLHYFPIEAEAKAIQQFNTLATAAERAAFVCLNAQEVETLKRMHLWSPNVDYYWGTSPSSYGLICNSDVVLSTGSTLGWEKLMLGGLSIFFEFADNKRNAYFSDIGLDCSTAPGDLAAFIRTARETSRGQIKNFVAEQNPDYIEQLAQEIVTNARNQ